MIKIERHNLDDIANQYLLKLQGKSRYKAGKLVRSHYIDNIGRLVLAKPSDFGNIQAEFNLEFQKQGAEDFNKFKDYMENQYNDMRNEHGYWLLKSLNIKVCPYCNRQYTFTIEEEKVSPELDHFYPKSIYPYLALSFYNLVPSCSVCNHTKLEQHIEIHPFFKGFDDNYKFKIKTKDGEEFSLDWALRNKLEIDFTDNNKNIKVFALKKLYNEHIDYVKEIIDKAQAYNQSYYNSLIDSYKGLGKQDAEIDRFVWGNYLENAEHEKRPLSKLTRDILEQLEIK
ncbi:MAG: hypothetical protein EOM47_10500 [Bacteroidia bacterium]|nr:hypothetical protein [Bacteroidia bacterium]